MNLKEQKPQFESSRLVQLRTVNGVIGVTVIWCMYLINLPSRQNKQLDLIKRVNGGALSKISWQ